MSSAISPSWNRDTRQYLVRHKHGLKNDESVIIKSPLLFDMFKRLSETERTTVFDIGCARQSSIDFFSDYWSKLFFADAIQALNKLDHEPEQEPVDIDSLLAKAIQFYQQTSPELDMILLWSLPNYLTPNHLKALVKYLMTNASSRVMLHAYLYNSEKMPAEPASYSILPDQRVAMSGSSKMKTNCPLYHLAELQNYFAPLKVEHSMILSSGVQEYIFSL